MTLQEFLSRFDGVRKRGLFHDVHCPAHPGDPKTKKLAVWEEEGWIKMRCWSGGCTDKDVIAAMGLQNSDLRTTDRPNGYEYQSARGQPVFRKSRVDKPGGKKEFYQSSFVDGEWKMGKEGLNGQAELLYHLPEVLAAAAEGDTIYVNEGEKACDAIRSFGQVATCQPHGANIGSWKPEHTECLRAARVVIVADRDEVGERYAKHVYSELVGIAARVSIVRSKTLGEKDDAFDHLGAGFSLEDFEPAVDLVPAPIFQVLSLDEIDKIPDTSWIIENFLPVRGLGMIYGQPGSGKTFVVLDLCMALIRGPHLFAKEFPVRQTCRIVYCAGEKMQGLKVRLRAARKKWAITSEEASRMSVVRGVPQLFDQRMEASTQTFIDEMKAAFPQGIDALFIDTKHAATIGSEENSASNAGTEIHHARLIQNALGCAILPVHHSGKSGSSERGSSAWKGAVDILLRVDKSENGDRTMVCEKMGDAPDNFTIAFALDHVPETESLGIEWTGRTEAVSKDVRTECLRILKSAARAGRPVEAKHVHDLFTIDATLPAVTAALKRLAAVGKEKTGVLKTEAHEGQPMGKKNWFLFEYNESWIEQPETAAPYKDSDDAEEFDVEAFAAAQEAYDPFADE